MTFVENASIKAKAIAVLAPGDFVMADDSGLEIDALNKEPGIYSARYLGEDTSYQIKNANLIERLNGVPDEKRTARFDLWCSAQYAVSFDHHGNAVLKYIVPVGTSLRQ